VGTQGFGVELTRGLARRWNVRFVVNLPTTFSYQKSASDTDYQIDLALGGVQATVDWHPLAGGFHLTGGLYRTRHRFTLLDTGGDSLEIGGDVYSRDEAGRLTGDGRVRQWAPYAGLGWGNALGRGKRWGVVFDLGFALQGRPRISLTASGPAAGTPEFRASLDREAGDVAGRLEGWRTFPVVAVSLSRRF
jgi:hypothetical protein